jgi:hypothetical protein
MELIPRIQETSSDVAREIMAAERRMVYVPSNPEYLVRPRTVSGLILNNPAKPMENKKHNSMKTYWAKMTPAERSAEMLRRKSKKLDPDGAAPLDAKIDAYAKVIAKTHEIDCPPAESSQPRATIPSDIKEPVLERPTAWADGTDCVTVQMPGNKKFTMNTAAALGLLRRLKSAVLGSI